ncbi:ATP-binding protein [Mangrovicoccus ximenensis]|uniref:ATP-binding protein n=1 Tax=Mangrovicoccus ximenensis TaxID=1911570 RepID=UPI002ECFCC6B
MSGQLERIRGALIGLRMPRALEALEHALSRLERGEITAVEAIDALLGEEYATREGRRIKVALRTAKLMPIKTLESFDFSFQPSLDRERIAALAQLDFVRRAEHRHLAMAQRLGHQPAAGRIEPRQVIARLAAVDRHQTGGVGDPAQQLERGRDIAVLRRVGHMHRIGPHVLRQFHVGQIRAFVRRGLGTGAEADRGKTEVGYHGLPHAAAGWDRIDWMRRM